MDAQNITLSLAFLAGLLSFASPCVLPLVPAYVGYLSGSALMADGQAGTSHETSRTFLHSLFFVLGFSAIFVLLGASASFIGRILFDYSGLLQRAGGVLLVIFGMRLMASGWSMARWIAASGSVALVAFLFNSGLVNGGPVEFGEYGILWVEESVILGLVVLAGANWSTARQAILAGTAGVLNFLASFDAVVPNLVTSLVIGLMVFFLHRTDLFYSEKRLHLQGSGQSGYLRSFVFGVIFAAGWTPCVGPILAMILVVASQLQTVGHGVLLLGSYSLGLAVPFLVLGLAFGPVAEWLRRARRYAGIVSALSGVLLVLMGILIFTDSLAFLARYGNLFNIEL